MQNPLRRRPTIFCQPCDETAQNDCMQTAIECEPRVRLMSNESQKGTIDWFRDENAAKNFDQLRSLDASEKERPEQIELLVYSERPGDCHRAVALVKGVIVIAHVKEGGPTSGQCGRESKRHKRQGTGAAHGGIELLEIDFFPLVHSFSKSQVISSPLNSKKRVTTNGPGKWAMMPRCSP